ncbi:hypothetical protein FB451DRAFT_1412602 [Mycena latifolia]|nr:hypothetical protein FB451DRAFT_1412602 [Mycena latifolia]
MGGTIWAQGPDQDEGFDIDGDDVVSASYAYRDFTDFKAILLRATTAFLTAFSAKQISKALLIQKGVATRESVEGTDEPVVIASYRAHRCGDSALAELDPLENAGMLSPQGMA